MNYIKRILPAFAFLALAFLAQAQTPAEDAAGIVTTASGIFTTVAALSLTMIGFYLIVRVVKGIKK